MFDIETKTSDYLSIVLTHHCNRHCPFCVDLKREKERGYIDIFCVEKALKFAQTKNIKDILLVGGEPTLHPQVLEIAKLVKKMMFNCILTTNYDFPGIVKQLDGIVDCFNISFYEQPVLPKQVDFKSDITLSTLILSQRFPTLKAFDEFIENHRDVGHLKFSTLTPCNDWCRKNYVTWLDQLIADKEFRLFDEILGQEYHGCIIKRYDKVLNLTAEQSWKCQLDGKLTQTW